MWVGVYVPAGNKVLRKHLAGERMTTYYSKGKPAATLYEQAIDGPWYQVVDQG